MSELIKKKKQPLNACLYWTVLYLTKGKTIGVAMELQDMNQCCIINKRRIFSRATAQTSFLVESATSFGRWSKRNLHQVWNGVDAHPSGPGWGCFRDEMATTYKPSRQNNTIYCRLFGSFRRHLLKKVTKNYTCVSENNK